MEYSGAGGKLICEKNQKQKISWHCPFKFVILISCKIPFCERKNFSKEGQSISISGQSNTYASLIHG